MFGAMRAVLSIALCAALGLGSGCTAVAVGALALGAGATVTAGVMYDNNCDGEGCAYGNVAALSLALVGVCAMAGGGGYLIKDHFADEDR